jgi:hypothetical protein
MAEESIGGPPRSFLIIGIIALLWNVFGVAAYIMQVTMSPEALANLPAAERALYDTMPSWVTGAFAIAVFTGLAGSVGLLMKKAWCVPVFQVSLVAIVLQFGYWLGFSGAVEVHGAGVYVMPALVTAIGVFLVWYSRDAKGKAWLS